MSAYGLSVIDQSALQALAGESSNVPSTKMQVAAQVDDLVAHGLPTLPGYIFKLNAILARTPVNLDEVAALVRSDPCLFTQILKICHSMPFAVPITQVEHAVETIGLERLQNLALTCTLLDPSLPREALLSLYAYWQHSVWAAILSENLATWIGYPHPERAYAAGLIHDIGIVPMVIGGIPMIDADISDHHVRIGKMLGQAWNYPAELVDVLEFHHQPKFAQRDAALAGMVAFADEYGESCGLGFAKGSFQGIPGSEPRLSKVDSVSATKLLKRFLPELPDARVAYAAQALDREYSLLLRTLRDRFDVNVLRVGGNQ